jgi:MFS family permease
MMQAMKDDMPLGRLRSWWAIFVFMIALMFNYLDRQLMTLLITPIKKDMHLSDTQISLLVGFMFVLFYLLVGIPISRLVDRGTRKWIISAGIAFWSAMTVACGLAGNFWQLALARMGVGVGESCNGPATYSMVGDMFPRRKLALPIAVINIGIVMGSGMALLVGGWLITRLTAMGAQTFPLVGELQPWQMTFVIIGLPGILWGLVIAVTVPEPPRREAEGNAQTQSIPQVLAFVHQWRAVYYPLVIAAGVKAMLSFGTSVWSPAFFERRFGYMPGEAGQALGIIALIASPLGFLLGGWWASRMAARGVVEANVRVLIWAAALLLPVAIALPLMPTARLAYLCVGLSLFLGSMGQAPANAAIQTITPGRMRGTISALYIAMFNVLGYGAGPLAVALLTDTLFRDENALHLSMALSAAVLGPLGLYFSWQALRTYGAAVTAAEQRGD